MPSRQLSIPEILLDQMKSLIDNGEGIEAIQVMDQLITWYADRGDPLGDIANHVERWRVVNAAGVKSSVFEDTCLDVLDEITSRQMTS